MFVDILFYYQAELPLNSFYNFQIWIFLWHTFLTYFLSVCHLNLLTLVQLFLCNFLLVKVCHWITFPSIIWSIKSSFTIVCNIFLNIICSYLYNETIYIYPYKKVFLFQYIFVLNNHTKTNILIFYLILVLKVLNGPNLCFFLFLLLISFLWNTL